ncbi:MAG: LacI family DNA-binding transcriptional regulator [Thermosediminibacteraceae bacterium]|nr:LacI family DNA-binding transcriptional regulator [Thermosediminibacteraceae bacterium]
MAGRRRKRVTMRDIAKKLNISINSVSIALNGKEGVSDELRSTIIKTAQEMGYFETNSRILSGFRYKSVSLLIEERHFRDEHFYSRVTVGIEQQARKNGYDVIINFIHEGQIQVPASIVDKRVAGILVVGPVNDLLLKTLCESGLPVVLVDHASFSINTDAVLTQNMQGTYMATLYLIGKGHRKIGFFGDVSYSLSVKERWLGYREALIAAKLEDRHIIKENAYSITGPVEKLVIEDNFEKVANLVSELKEMPTAWVCSNDRAAITLCKALKNLDIRVPEDVSVIGFDDIGMASIFVPHLTTVKVEKELMGKKAFERLLEKIEQKDDTTYHIRLPVSFVERDSVREIKA